MLFLSSTIYFLLHFLSVIGNLNVKGYNFFRRKAPEEAVVPDEKKRGNAVQTFLTFFTGQLLLQEPNGNKTPLTPENNKS